MFSPGFLHHAKSKTLHMQTHNPHFSLLKTNGYNQILKTWLGMVSTLHTFSILSLQFFPDSSISSTVPSVMPIEWLNELHLHPIFSIKSVVTETKENINFSYAHNMALQKMLFKCKMSKRHILSTHGHSHFSYLIFNLCL